MRERKRSEEALALRRTRQKTKEQSSKVEWVGTADGKGQNSAGKGKLAESTKLRQACAGASHKGGVVCRTGFVSQLRSERTGRGRRRPLFSPALFTFRGRNNSHPLPPPPTLNNQFLGIYSEIPPSGLFLCCRSCG